MSMTQVQRLSGGVLRGCCAYVPGETEQRAELTDGAMGLVLQHKLPVKPRKLSRQHQQMPLLITQRQGGSLHTS